MRERVEQDGLRDRLEPAAGNSLDDPPEYQHGKACGHAAKGRGQGEESHTSSVMAASGPKAVESQLESGMIIALATR